jgi:hypothetical protein
MQQTQKANTPEISFCTESSSTISSASPVEEEEERTRRGEAVKRFCFLNGFSHCRQSCRSIAATYCFPLHRPPFFVFVNQCPFRQCRSW